MMTAKLFENGRSQAVRLPKECRFSGEEVAVNKIGDIVILMPKDDNWSGFLDSLNLFPRILWIVAVPRASGRSGRSYEVYAGHEYLHLYY